MSKETDSQNSINIELQQSIKYYAVDYKGVEYLIISTYDANTDYESAEVLNDGEVLEDEIIEDAILEAFDNYNG